MKLKHIEGSVCAAKGFTASGVHCGIRKNQSKADLALITCSVRAAAAAVYTQNLVKGAPVTLTKAHLADGYARAIICNSGNANTCNANGMEIAEKTCAITAYSLHIAPEDVIVASTGVIGVPMDIAPFAAGIPAAAAALKPDATDAATAIMTTDTRRKEIAVEFEVGGKVCKLGAIAKGSGMIHPNMATMLVFVTTDVAVSPEMLQKALSQIVPDTFNMISIDGDTSTNDMCAVLASGLAGNEPITGPGEGFDALCEALKAVMLPLSRMIAADGEGATKLLECHVTGAPCKDVARKVAKGVISSSLFKAAMYGCDANWGRALCAIGYAGCEVDVSKVDLSFTSKSGVAAVCKGGVGAPFSEEEAKKILSDKEVGIEIDLNSGDESATAFGCDLTVEYVRINGDYRS